MVWQDIVVAIANILFGYSLVYQVYFGFKKRKGLLSKQTSILTTIALYALSVAYFSLNLYLSAVIGIFNGTMWLLLFIQGIIYEKA
jgi:hypothetical protein